MRGEITYPVSVFVCGSLAMKCLLQGPSSSLCSMCNGEKAENLATKQVWQACVSSVFSKVFERFNTCPDMCFFSKSKKSSSARFHVLISEM